MVSMQMKWFCRVSSQVCYVIMLALTLAAGGCCQPVAASGDGERAHRSGQIAVPPLVPGMAGFNEGASIRTCRQALDLYRAGKGGQALAVSKRLASGRLTLISPGAILNTEDSFDAVMRGAAAVAAVALANVDYARELAANKRYDAAIGVLKTNLSIAEALACAHPEGYVVVFHRSIGIWESSTKALADVYRQRGNRELSLQMSKRYNSALALLRGKIASLLKLSKQSAGNGADIRHQEPSRSVDRQSLERARKLWFREVGWRCDGSAP